MAFLACQGMPTAAGSIRREHAEAFIAAELECTTPSSAATHYRSLQQLFGWLDEEDEIHRSPMAAMRPLKIPDKPAPVLPDEDARHLPTHCAGKDFRDRPDLAIIIRPYSPTLSSLLLHAPSPIPPRPPSPSPDRTSPVASPTRYRGRRALLPARKLC